MGWPNEVHPLDGTFEMTKDSLKKLCRDLKLYSSCPELNEVIHLHQKGIVTIQALEAYTGLRTVYLECNAISKLEGLAPLINLRCLYLNQNLVEHISGLEPLQNLEILDLADNQIRKVKGLDCLPQLRQLNLSGNCIKTANDVAHLVDCKSIRSLDMSKNRIDKEEALHVLRSIPLSLLRMTGNQVLCVTSQYRKQTIASMPTLHYLDESPVFEKERRLATAWMEGGLEAEKDMRTTISNEEKAVRERHRQAFEDMKEKAKKEHVEKLMRQEQLKCLRREEEKLEEVRIEKQREEENIQEAKRKQDEDGRFEKHKEYDSHERKKEEEDATIESHAQNDVNLLDSTKKAMSEGEKRGGNDLGYEYPQKSCKQNLDEMDSDECVCEVVQNFMELDCIYQGPNNSQSTSNINHNDLKDVAISRFLEAVKDPINTKFNNVRLSTNMGVSNGQECQILSNDAHVEEIKEVNNEVTQQGMQRYQLIQESKEPSQPIFSQDIDVIDVNRHDASNNEKLLKAWTFKKSLQERVLQRAMENVDKRDRENLDIEKENDTGLQVLARPIIWGTKKYQDLWAKAATIDDDMHSEDSTSSCCDEELMYDESHLHDYNTCEEFEGEIVYSNDTMNVV